MKILMVISLIAARALWIYSMLIWIRIMFSWFIRSFKEGGFMYYIAKVVDPYLGLFKSRKAVIGMLDFSPIIAIGIIEIMRSILSFFGIYGKLTLGFVLSTFIVSFWSYCISLFLILAGIMLLMKTIASFSQNPMMRASGERFSEAVSPITGFVRDTFFSKNRIVKDSTVNLISLIIVFVFYFVLRYLFVFLANKAMTLPF